MKTLLCLGLMLVVSIPWLRATEVTQGVYQAGVVEFLQDHLTRVSRSGERVVLSGDGEVFAVNQHKQNITGFSDRIVLRQAGDSFIANFGAGERVNTVLTLVSADASRIELRYRVMDSRRGVLRMDDGTVFLSVVKPGGGA